MTGWPSIAVTTSSACRPAFAAGPFSVMTVSLTAPPSLSPCTPMYGCGGGGVPVPVFSVSITAKTTFGSFA